MTTAWGRGCPGVPRSPRRGAALAAPPPVAPDHVTLAESWLRGRPRTSATCSDTAASEPVLSENKAAGTRSLTLPPAPRCAVGAVSRARGVEPAGSPERGGYLGGGARLRPPGPRGGICKWLLLSRENLAEGCDTPPRAL